MWAAGEPIDKLGNTAKFMMKKTLGKGVNAMISAFSKCPEDHGNIWNFLKESGIVEKELGENAALSSYMREIVIAYNKSTTSRERVQILSLVSKLGFGRLKKFNPPIEETSINEEIVMDTDGNKENDDDIEDDNNEQVLLR